MLTQIDVEGLIEYKGKIKKEIQDQIRRPNYLFFLITFTWLFSLIKTHIKSSAV